jgi:hypothetical protein
MKIGKKGGRLEHLENYKETRKGGKKRQEEMIDWTECRMEEREALQAAVTPVRDMISVHPSVHATV